MQKRECQATRLSRIATTAHNKMSRHATAGFSLATYCCATWRVCRRCEMRNGLSAAFAAPYGATLRRYASAIEKASRRAGGKGCPVPAMSPPTHWRTARLPIMAGVAPPTNMVATMFHRCRTVDSAPPRCRCHCYGLARHLHRNHGG